MASANTMALRNDMAYTIEEKDPEVINVELLKKYRHLVYDNYDEMYARQMKTYAIPPEFNTFTDGLMNEQYISRSQLLDAIKDYNLTNPSNTLSDVFIDNAFNYRPHQPCIIS